VLSFESKYLIRITPYLLRCFCLVKTNKENLLEIALQGAITHTAVPASYTTTWDGKSQLGMGRGGIIYNVKIGDPVYGWELGENVEPGGIPSMDGNSVKTLNLEYLLMEPILTGQKVASGISLMLEIR